MNRTPFFGPWIHCLAPMGARIPQAVARVRAYTLCQLENCFRRWLPRDLFPKASSQANSRDRHYSHWRTFWCSLWQNLNPQASCREVVRQLQALFKREGGPRILQGKVKELVLAHKDRLLRFGSEIIFQICQHMGVRITVLNDSQKKHQ